MASFSLPDLPEVRPETLRSIARRHDLDARDFSILPGAGVFNAIYLLGEEVVLRVPRNHPAFVAAARKEAIAVPAARSAGVPLRVVPFLLEGYRQITPLDDEENAEARILWRHLQLSLYLLRREPQPGRSWAERPLAMLLEIWRFFNESPGARWVAWAP
jgi:hypothetical protein